MCAIFPEVTPIFSKLKILEKFVVVMYDRSSTLVGVVEARVDLFASKQKPYEVIPPPRTALMQQTKHAVFQAACVWAQANLH